jgi:GH25 family lysozyme M1 (1,4-beta-N-acetylmuramidase)
MKKGIDVSFAQGKVDWTKVKADFAIIRAGYGREVSQEDSQFKNNYAGCKSNDIPCGVYWFSYAESAEDAKREAKACMEVIKGKQFEYPVFFDLEEGFQFDRGKSFCDSLVKAFCGELEAVNNATNNDIKIEMINNNNISNEADVDGIIDYLAKGLREALVTSAEGVHR